MKRYNCSSHLQYIFLILFFYLLVYKARYFWVHGLKASLFFFGDFTSVVNYDFTMFLLILQMSLRASLSGSAMSLYTVSSQRIYIHIYLRSSSHNHNFDFICRGLSEQTPVGLRYLFILRLRLILYIYLR